MGLATQTALFSVSRQHSYVWNLIAFLVLAFFFATPITLAIEKGKITGNYELIFDDKFNISNFLAEGYVKNFQAKVNKNLKLENASFLYFVEKNSLDLKNLKGSLNNLLISEGSLNLSSSDEIEIASDFKTSIKLNLKDIKKILPKNKDYLDNKLKNLFINEILTLIFNF
mgnify:CR=1 FL=1